MLLPPLQGSRRGIGDLLAVRWFGEFVTGHRCLGEESPLWEGAAIDCGVRDCPGCRPGRSCGRESSSQPHTPRVRRHSSPAQRPRSARPARAVPGACRSDGAHAMPRTLLPPSVQACLHSAFSNRPGLRRYPCVPTIVRRAPVTGRSKPPSTALQHSASTAVQSRPSTDVTRAPRSPTDPDHAAAAAGDVVRWAAFSCVLVPVVLLVYGTSLAGAAGTALGLAAVTAVCRMLLRQSERDAGAIRASRAVPDAAPAAQPHRTGAHARRHGSAGQEHQPDGRAPDHTGARQLTGASTDGCPTHSDRCFSANFWPRAIPCRSALANPRATCTERTDGHVRTLRGRARDGEAHFPARRHEWNAS